ncbi:hypothetical protein [Pleionea sp. CnH1-48]|uniref:hypothetical protein n=1 Tax=Pleionea sp. CnH1-48 TaxID=2954494 RepID=UPI002096F62A|nr:hypothetical protein [Pleionea sp. CnH1-48]MCO7226532.1 hypothetical protein [Pleionea sp. CnH1-48]
MYPSISLLMRIFLLGIISIFSVFTYATSFEERRQLFIEHALDNPNGDSLVIAAQAGLPLNQQHLQALLNDLDTIELSDFRLIKLIRILNYTRDYDAQILPIMSRFPYWLTRGEDTRVYWSENHMIMWMSSSWLMYEREGWSIEANLRQRLVHYLKLKVEYGYYEFFSSVYFPYTMSGLLNLADFAEDPEIKMLATQAVKRLLKEVLMATNDQGAFFPAAGRNKTNKYTSAYGANHNKIIYLLTGMGHPATTASTGSGILATTEVDMNDVLNSWQPQVNTQLIMGHSFGQFDALLAPLPKQDKYIFQWSAGGYFHPDVAEDTLWMLKEYDLWDHKNFDEFPGFSGFPGWIAKAGAKVLASITRSSVLTGAKVHIYKNQSSMLSSVQDYWSGRLGHQQWPWAATTGTIAVWTQSGAVKSDWHQRSSSNVNTHLPYIKQNENVALIMYKANNDLSLFGFNDQDVSLYWPTERFDETRAHDHWVLGREGDSYVAVRRHCKDTQQSIMACAIDGQTWAVVVGNQSTHGSFDQFEAVIRAAQYSQKWKWNWRQWRYEYSGSIKVDGKSLAKTW